MKLVAKANRSVKTKKTEKKHREPQSLKSLQENPPKGPGSIIRNFVQEHKLDGAACWISGKVNILYLKRLAYNAPDFSSKTVKSNKYIAITGQKKLITWGLVSLNGDTYIRTHPADKFCPEDVQVRGSLTLLRKAYGESNVKIVDQNTVVKLQKTLKTDPSCIL